MKKGQKLIKLEFAPGTCAICKSDDDELKCIKHNHLFNHSVENYGEMFLKCFSIQLVNSEDKTVGVEICGSCVSSLRSATSFRQLVEGAEKTQQKKAPYLKNGKSQRKGVLNAKKKPYSKAKQKSHGAKESTKHKEKVLQLTEKIVDNNDCSRPEANHEVKLEPCLEEFNDNLSDLSDQPLSEVQEDSNSVNKYDIFISTDQVTQSKSSTTSAQIGHQFEVKLKPSKELNDNLSKLSDQPLSKVPEDSNSEDIYDIFDGQEQVSDGESSTTSAQIKIATGYEREMERDTVRVIEQRKKKKTVMIPPLDISCRMCPICSQKFEDRRLLSTHYGNHFPNFVCEICGLSYYKSGSYYQHRKQHLSTKLKALTCPLCSKTFLKSGQLSSHIQSVHNKVKPLSCSECDARFSNTDTKRRHMASKHGKECTMYLCPICKLTLYSSFKLNNHIKRTHYNVKNCFCTVCDKGFYGKQELREHMVMHTDAGKYKCTECEKGFPRLRSLTEHLKIHNNIKDHVCEVCNKAFVQKSALKTHMKVHNKISG